VEDDVLRLQVAVDDLAFVHIVQRLANLLHDDASKLLIQFSLSL